MEHADECYLSVEEAAGILQLNPRAVARLVKSGELGGTEFGREWRVATRDLAAFVGRSFGRTTQSSRRRNAS